MWTCRTDPHFDTRHPRPSAERGYSSRSASRNKTKKCSNFFAAWSLVFATNTRQQWSIKLTRYQFPILSLGVSGPFRLLQLTHPTQPIGELMPASLLDCACFAVFPSVHAHHTHIMRSVSLRWMPCTGSLVIRSIVSYEKWPMR